MQQDRLRTYEGAVVIMTGGASGIGLAMAQALADRGAEVILADRQIDLAGPMAQQIQASGGKAFAAELDVTQFEAVRDLIQQTREKHGRIDYLFNNAGIVVGGEARHYQLEDWTRVIDVNLQGVIHGAQAIYPVMRDQGFGHIVNTASIAGLVPLAGLLSYSTSKHAVVGLSTCLRVEAASYGIHVSVLCPGAVETAIVGGGKYGKVLNAPPPEVQRKLWEKGKPIPPEEFARSALKAIARNKAIIVIPWRWKILWWIYRLFPGLGMALARKQYRDTQRALEESRGQEKTEQ